MYIEAQRQEENSPMTDDEKNAMDALKRLLHDRIEGVARGELSTNTIESIFDEVLQEKHGGAE
jgi:Antitoxin ParD